MTREEKIKRKVTIALDQLVRNEEMELGKTKKRRTRCYWIGFVLIFVPSYVSLMGYWPAWLTTVIAALGGIGVGLGMLYDNSINQWPALKPFVDAEKLSQAAAQYQNQVGSQ